MSFLYVWGMRHQQILWITFTTAPGGDASKLLHRQKLLLGRIKTAFGFNNVEYFYVVTGEGNGVLHALWSWKSGRGRAGRFHVPVRWLWEAWNTLHKSRGVYVKRFQEASRSGRAMACYLMTQYVAGQRAIVRHGGSYKRTFGFSVSRAWAQWRACAGRMQMPFKDMVAGWQTLLRGERVDYGGRQVWLGRAGLWDEEAPDGERTTVNV